MKKSLLFLLLLICTTLSAQQWTNCTSGHYVIDIIEQDEILWVATTGGLVKHNTADGSSQVYNRGNSPLPTNIINSLAIDSEDQLWVSSNLGTAIFDGNSWQIFRDKSGILHLDQDNRMVLVANNDINWWNGQAFESIDLPFPFDDYLYIKDVEIDLSNGDLWLSYYTYGQYAIYKYSNGIFTSFDYENSPLPFESAQTNPIQLDTENRLWAGNNAGLFRYENGSWVTINDIIPGFPAGEVSALDIDADGNIWAAVTSDWINPEGQLVKIISDDEIEFHALPGAFGDLRKVESLKVVGSPGFTIYAGSPKFGLWAYDLNTWSKIPTDQSAAQSNLVKQIFIDGTTTYIHTARSFTNQQNYLFSIDEGAWQFFDESDVPFSLEGNYGPTFLTKGPGDNLWVNSGDSLFAYKDNTWTLAEVPDLVPGVEEINSFIHFEPDGKRWLLERYHSYIFYESDEGWKTFPHAEHGAVSGNYEAFFTHPITGDFWLASANGISRYDGQSWTFIKPRDVGLSSSWVTSMVVNDQGVVYANTYDGILKFENNEPEIFVEDIPGLEGRLFGTLALDSENRLWVGLSGAIAFFDGGSWQTFDNTNSGVPNGRINQIAFDDSNNLWLSSSSGSFGIFNPDGLPDYLLEDFHISPTGTFLEQPEQNLTVYPNPVSRDQSLTLEIPFDFPIDNSTDYAIYNSIGQLVFKRKLLTHRLNIPLYPIQAAGTYFLHIQNNSESITAKVLIY